MIRRGRISTLREPRWARRKPISIRAGVRVTAFACSIGWSRNITNPGSRLQENPYDGSAVLSFAEHVARKRVAAAPGKIAGARLARGRAIDLAGAHRGARCAFVDRSEE